VRQLTMEIKIPAGELVFRSELGIKAKRPGQPKPFHEQRVGATLHRDTQTWRQRQRLIDRDTDRYVEVITDADGREVHHCEESLSAHVGHGSAKRRR
jgi:hypothetical protein